VYANWVIVAIHGLRKYLDHLYRRLLAVLREMPGIVGGIGIKPAEIHDFSRVCPRKQALAMAV
jgi:hypothetical protein